MIHHFMALLRNENLLQNIMENLSEDFSLGTNLDSNFNQVFYSPNTPWPQVPENFLMLPPRYDIDLDRARTETQALLQRFSIRPFQVGSKTGRSRSRLSYRGLGLSSRPGSEDPLYDSLNLYGRGNQQLDIYETFANYSEKKPGAERILEVLDESQFSELTEACTPYFQEIIKRFNSPFSKIRLLQLMPGGIIPPHVDFPYYEGIRVHSVLETNSDVIWEVNGEQRRLPADGKFYWFDTGKYHAVVNRGKTPRLVLSLNLLVYKNRDGSSRLGPQHSLVELIQSGQV
jgi:hypothetical protein